MNMDENINYEYISGINPVCSLIKVNAGNRKIYQIIINEKSKKDPRIKDILKEAGNENIDIREFESARFSKLYSDNLHNQGICARVSPYNYCSLERYLEKEASGRSRLVILDGVTDVGNLGSIIRNCSAFDFEGIIIPKRRSAAINERINRISAGALEEVKIFRVVNIVRTIKELKNRRFWIYGTTLDINGNTKYIDEVDFTLPMALVLGSEDRGISRLVGTSCDIMVSIKLGGRMQSLNVSVAGGIVLYKIQEQIERKK